MLKILEYFLNERGGLRMKKYPILITNAIAIIVFILTSSVSSQEPRKIPEKIKSDESEIYFSSSNFQSGIRKDINLGALAQEHSFIGKDATTFGFAAKSEEAKFFIIGSLYSESLAFLKSGQFDLVTNRLKSIEKEFIKLNVPSSMYNYITKVRNMVERKRYSEEVLEEFLSLFQPIYEDYAKGRSNDKLILFRAGSWLVDMSLTAAAGDKNSLKQGPKLDYFIKEMKRMDAPKGVLDALDNIAKITEKEEITDRDVNKILKLVNKIQTILG